jgi:hypothetical protein
MTRRSQILTNLLLSLPLATGLLCAASNASAQTSATFTVPFAFSANNWDMPAGSYNVQRLTYRIVSLRNLKTGRNHLLMVRPDDSERMTDTKGRLVFQRYGTRNYLKQVWIDCASVHSELVVRPRLEQHLAKQTPPAGSSVVAALK